MVFIRRIAYSILAALWAIWPISIAAQTSSDTVKSLPGIEITTSVDSATVYIGDLITYSISITRDSSYQLIPPPLGANLGAFDVKDYQPDVETKLEGGRIKSVTTFKLSTFTTGDYIIPPVPITFTLKDGTRRVLLAEAVPITVESLLQNTNDSLDIHANKPQYEFRRRYGSWYLGIGLILFLVAANLLIWWWIRKRKREAENLGRRAPWEVASERLARLEQKGLPAEAKFREYYFDLTELARDYLGRMYSADVLEMTTEEFLDHFRTVELPTGMFDSCSALLRHADLVKFAKYVPEVERCHADFQAVRVLIEQVRADYERRRAAEITSAQTPPAPTVAGGGAHG